jgi:hypothetical protein
MKAHKDSGNGNIWGWKFSFYGLALILILLGLMVYRHISLGVPFGAPEVEVNNSESIINQ